MILKKIIWAFKRHPFLYLSRFRLLSKNSDLSEINDFNYNQLNFKKDIPDFFHEVNLKIFERGKSTTDFEIVKQLSSWLKDHIKGGPGLSEPSEKALQTMLDGKGGVCSDMAQIFNNFCVINDIPVREWGTTTAPFNADFGGHSFNEVFIEDFNKWILVDVSYNMFFYNTTEIPLSVIELYQLQRSSEKVSFGTFNRNEIIDPQIINKNYLNEGITPFLICNYRNSTYDHFLKLSKPFVPIFMTHFIIYLFNKSYHYRFPLDNYKNIFS